MVSENKQIREDKVIVHIKKDNVSTCFMMGDNTEIIGEYWRSKGYWLWECGVCNGYGRQHLTISEEDAKNEIMNCIRDGLKRFRVAVDFVED